MKNNTKWFSHDYNSRSDGKILKLRMKHGMEGVGVYWCIVEMLYEQDGFMGLNEYDRITFELRTNEELVRSVIHDFQLFEINCDKFWSNTGMERLAIRKDKSEQAKDAINKRWEEERKRKSLITNTENTDVLPPNNDSNTIKDSIVNNNKGNNNTKAPKKEDFLAYCKERCIGEGLDFSKYQYGASTKYDAWLENGWEDLNGNVIQNWKSKVINNLQYFKSNATSSPNKGAIIEVPKDTDYSNVEM